MLGCMVVCVTEILQEQSLIIILTRGIGQANRINLTQKILLIIGLRFKMQQLMFDFRINQLWITYKRDSDWASGIWGMLIFPCWYITKFNSSTRNSAYSYYYVTSSGDSYWYCSDEYRMCL